MVKPCNPLNKKYKKSPQKYICNDKTGRWVLKTGKIGTSILMLEKSLYKNELYKTKDIYNVKIPLLDKLKVSYETWNNTDNTAGTCFWHAISAGLNIPIKRIASDIENMSTELPSLLKEEYKTKEKVAKALMYYKERDFGIESPSFCIVPKIYKNTMIVVFTMAEKTQLNFELEKIMYLTSTPEHKLKNIIFLCDLIFMDGDAHIEIMTINTDTISPSWSQPYTTNIHNLIWKIYNLHSKNEL